MRPRSVPVGSAANARLGVCVAMLALAACGANKQQTAAIQAAEKNAAAAKQHPTTAADQTATMVQAPTSGKATAPMQLKFEITDRPVAGQTIDMDLALMVTAPAQSVTLHLADSAGIVYADSKDRPLGAVVPDTVYRQDLKLSASAEGVYFVGITAIMSRDTLIETRNFSIPVIVSAQ
jgi:glucose/arabinose dehydrogenase